MGSIMNDDHFYKKGYVVSTDKALIDFDVVHGYLCKDSYWAQEIPADTLKRAIENTICFGIYKEKRQVGFSRVISDKATFAYICDVFVLPAFRGIGLSKWLVQTIVAHPELQDLRRWSLATLDAHGLYRQMGFVELSKPGNWMEIYRPDIYRGT
jgi:GNAT superfamily N-acetyltransferase